MKVLIINSACGKGSTGRICRDLAQMVQRAGAEAVIAYGRDSFPLPGSHRIGSEADVRFHGLLTRLFDAHGFGSRRATEVFAAWMESYDPDIIHLHNIHGYYLHIGVLFEALRKLGKPVVWTLHDCWAFTGHCAHYSSIGCEKWREGCHHCERKGAYPASLFADRCAENYEAKKHLFTLPEKMTVVTPSQWLAGQAEGSFLGKYPVQTIHNGIDTDIFCPTKSDLAEKYGIAGRKIALGAAGVWSEDKGLDDMYRLADRLGDSWAVVLVGLTQKQIAALPENITGVLRTENARELAMWYSAADVFVNPTRADTFPTTNLEAQACGSPVVTFPTGGSPEGIYPPLREWLVCPDREIETLADRVRRAAALSGAKRQEMADWCRQTYAREVYLERYRRLYQSLLGM